MRRAVQKLRPMPDYRLYADEVPLLFKIAALIREWRQVLENEILALKHEDAELLHVLNHSRPNPPIEQKRAELRKRMEQVKSRRSKQRSKIQARCNQINDNLRSLHGRDYDHVMSNWVFWRAYIPDGKQSPRELVIAGADKALRTSEEEPVKISTDVWIFNGFEYQVEGLYTDEQFRLLIHECFDSEKRRFERLKQKHVQTPHADSTSTRPRIPQNVRIEVWRRDGGKCVRCGSRDNLEYDHIIPISKGGSNTARNIELLCEPCNRSKGANIA